MESHLQPLQPPSPKRRPLALPVHALSHPERFSPLDAALAECGRVLAGLAGASIILAENGGF